MKTKVVYAVIDESGEALTWHKDPFTNKMPSLCIDKLSFGHNVGTIFLKHSKAVEALDKTIECENNLKKAHPNLNWDTDEWNIVALEVKT